MRKKAEVIANEEGCFDLLWYVRHKTQSMPAGTPQAIIDRANQKTVELEAKIDPEYLADLLRFDYEYGMLCGRLVALRWMLGMDWAEDGILDT